MKQPINRAEKPCCGHCGESIPWLAGGWKDSTIPFAEWFPYSLPQTVSLGEGAA